ncbi:MAG: hypothetical protein JO242_26120 [Streptosporangiaceae bacterium]|nr:hypothetical protein [Streptosporangiaceae bacterium]
MYPATALPVRDAYPDKGFIRALVRIPVTHYSAKYFLGDHKDQRRDGFLQGFFDRSRVQQPECDVEIFAEKTVVILVDLTGVHHGAQPYGERRLDNGSVMLGEQDGESRDEPAEQDGLRHIVVRPYKHEDAVAAVGELVQVLLLDAGRVERAVQQFVQDAPQLGFDRIGAIGGALEIQRDY